MANTSNRSGTVGIIVMVVGVIFAVAGVVTYFIVSNELANENITVSEDAKYFAGKDVKGPFTAYSEAETISKHALEATGGKTYAELDRGRPTANHGHAGVLPAGVAVHLRGRLRRRRPGGRSRRHAGPHRMVAEVPGTHGGASRHAVGEHGLRDGVTDRRSQ